MFCVELWKCGLSVNLYTHCLAVCDGSCNSVRRYLCSNVVEPYVYICCIFLIVLSVCKTRLQLRTDNRTSTSVCLSTLSLKKTTEPLGSAQLLLQAMQQCWKQHFTMCITLCMWLNHSYHKNSLFHSKSGNGFLKLSFTMCPVCWRLCWITEQRASGHFQRVGAHASSCFTCSNCFTSQRLLWTVDSQWLHTGLHFRLLLYCAETFLHSWEVHMDVKVVACFDEPGNSHLTLQIHRALQS